MALETRLAENAGDAVEVGVVLPFAASSPGDLHVDRLVAAAVRAEDAGFDSIWTGDHIVHPRPLLESVVALSFVAARTRRIRLGTAVLLIALRRPAVVARQLATLSCLSHGRLVVGVGVGGEYPDEWRACDVPIRERGARTEQAVLDVQRMLSGAGSFDMKPLPPAPVPFLFAGRHEAALRRAARLGNGWLGYLLSPSGFERCRHVLLDERDRQGLESGQFRLGMLLPIHLASSASEGRASVRGHFGGGEDAVRYVIAGTAQEVIERLAAYYNAGCRTFVLAVSDMGPHYERGLDEMATSLLPAIRAFNCSVGPLRRPTPL